jgi:ComF family protein
MAPVCAACREPLDHPTRGAVCDACWSAAVPPTPLGCDALPPVITLATAIGPYEGRLRDIVHALKYDPRPTIARPLAARMRAAGADALADADVVVPVPLHRSRERARGFNQARELARHLGRPMADVLVRTRKTETQTDLPAERRHVNVRGAFTVRRAAALEGRIVVLVDDVRTTGATLSVCASVLLNAGAVEVRALTAAKASLRVTSLRKEAGDDNVDVATHDGRGGSRSDSGFDRAPGSAAADPSQLPARRTRNGPGQESP